NSGFSKSGSACVTNAGWAAQNTGTQDLLSVWGSSSTDIYAVGISGTILHSTGNGIWTPQASGLTDTLSSVWGSYSGDVYAIGLNTGAVLHSGGGAWTPKSSLSGGGAGLWGSGSGNVYAASDHSVLHLGGNGSWSTEWLPFPVT